MKLYIIGTMFETETKKKEREKKVEEIFSSMKLANKALLLYGDGNLSTHAIPGSGLSKLNMNDGPCGVKWLPVNEKSTAFPNPCLSACSWDVDLMEELGKAIGKECAYFNVDIILGPGANIKRNPLCGRNYEYFSEDPLLSGKIAAGYIRGVQSTGVGACLKHFAANNQETLRHYYSAEVDLRALQEIYLKGFKIAIDESDPWSIMCSYNRIRGVYSSENEWLLQKTLRDEWGYEGVVMSDWGAVLHPMLCHNSGLDLEMPCFENRAKTITKSVKNGTISHQKFDKSVKRLIDLNLKCGHYDANGFSFENSYQIALKVAEESMVLAKNANDILPLSNYDDCCIIGAYASTPKTTGLGSASIPNDRSHFSYSLLDFFKTKKGINVPYEKGYSLDGEDNDSLTFKAVDLASSKKKVILVLGTPEYYESEGYDRPDMRLPDNQISLFKSLYSVNKNIIVVICSGAPVEIPFASEAKAILLAYFGGSASSEAIHKILLGEANPSGKTAETWPLHYYDVPGYASFGKSDIASLYKESIYVGYRYYVTANKDVLFPFGHGLSYSKFAYSDLNISKDKIDGKKTAKVSLKVKNTSKISGKEVIQLYVSQEKPSIFKPARELKGFKKIHLEPNEEKEVQFTIDAKTFEHWSTTSEKFETERGIYRIEIGSSCEDIKLKSKIEIASGVSENKLYHTSFLPSYYNLGSREFFVMDYEFDTLLDHRFRNRKKKKYDWNSSLEDLCKKKSGKKLFDEVVDKTLNPNDPANYRDLKIKEYLKYPIRLLCMYGYKEKKLKKMLDLANKKPFKAFKHSILYSRKK